MVTNPTAMPLAFAGYKMVVGRFPDAFAVPGVLLNHVKRNPSCIIRL